MAQAQIILTPQQQRAIPILALQSARRTVRAQLQRKGIKLSLTTAATITALAEDYALAHRAELLPQAIALAQRIYPTPVHHSEHSNRKRSPAAQGLPLCETHVQNGSAE
jgi:hypothetical protein